jgi:hypothetical protein
MREVFQIYAQVAARQDGDRGRVCEGWYTVENGVLTMTDPEGIPIRDVDGVKIDHKLKEGESARTIASRLTLKIFNARFDDMADFNRPTSAMKYSKLVF